MPKYKLTEDGKAIEMKDGQPVVIGDDNKEFTIDAINAQTKITELNSEAAGHRKKASDYKAIATHLDGIDDPAAFIALAKTNQGLVSSMDDKNKADVEAAVGNLNKTWQEKFDAEVTRGEGLSGQLFEANVKTKFFGSKAVGTTVLPPGIAYATFKDHFSADGTAKDAKGNQILSKEDPSKPAGFEESMTHLIANYPQKDEILKGANPNGSGSGGAGGGNGSGDGEKTSHQNIAEGLKARGFTS